MRFRSLAPFVIVMLLLLATGAGVFQVTRTVTKTQPNPKVPMPSPTVDMATTEPGFVEIPREDSALVGATEPKTAEATPPPELGSLGDRMSRRTDDLEIISHPDGRRSVDLRGRFSHISARVIGADGIPVVQCFSDYESLMAALTRQPAVGPPLPAAPTR